MAGSALRLADRFYAFVNVIGKWFGGGKVSERAPSRDLGHDIKALVNISKTFAGSSTSRWVA